MTKFTDQHLSAFIDGELSEALSNDLQVALEQDEALANRLRALERANEEFLSAHRNIADEPIPQRFLDVLNEAGADVEEEDTIVQFQPRAQPMRAWLMPLAAGLVLAIGVAVGAQFTTGPVSASSEIVFAGPVGAGSELHEVLETVASGQSEIGVSAILTFATREGGYCRELATETTRALACRDPDAERWTVLAAASQPSPSDATAYYPASASGSESIDSLVDRLIIGIPMTQDEETSLIEDGWRDDSGRDSAE